MQKMTWCRFGKGAIKTIAAMILKEERDALEKRARAAEREAHNWHARACRATDELRDAEGKRDENWELYERILRENHELTNEIVDLKLVRDVQAAKLEELRSELNVATIKGQDLAIQALARLSAFASNRIGYELGRGLPDDHELRIQAVIERLSKRGVG